MAFKRSAVRSRLSPPEKSTLKSVLFFFASAARRTAEGERYSHCGASREQKTGRIPDASESGPPVVSAACASQALSSDARSGACQMTGLRSRRAPSGTIMPYKRAEETRERCRVRRRQRGGRAPGQPSEREAGRGQRERGKEAKRFQTKSKRPGAQPCAGTFLRPVRHRPVSAW